MTLTNDVVSDTEQSEAHSCLHILKAQGAFSLSEQKEFGNGRKQRINYATSNSMATVILKVLLPYKTPTPDTYTGHLHRTPTPVFR